MSNTPLSSDDLVRLRRYAEQNAREPWIPVKAAELLALLDCADQLEWARTQVAQLEEVNATLERSNNRLREKCDRLADTAMARGDR